MNHQCLFRRINPWPPTTAKVSQGIRLVLAASFGFVDSSMQLWQLLTISSITFVIPGNQTVSLARAWILSMPKCSSWKRRRISDLYDFVTDILAKDISKSASLMNRRLKGVWRLSFVVVFRRVGPCFLAIACDPLTYKVRFLAVYQPLEAGAVRW